MKHLIILTLLILNVWTLGHASEATMTRTNAQGLGIDGYSPVSYFEHNRAELGSAEYEWSWDGVRYRFTSQNQLQQFKQNPEQYLPAHGGWCSLMLSGSGNLTPANPESFTIVDGQLLLFWQGEYKGQHISGLSNWKSKTKGKLKKARKRLNKANQTWDKIVAGQAQPKLLLFADSDRERLDARRLKQAQKAY